MRVFVCIHALFACVSRVCVHVCVVACDCVRARLTCGDSRLAGRLQGQIAFLVGDGGERTGDELDSVTHHTLHLTLHVAGRRRSVMLS